MAASELIKFLDDYKDKVSSETMTRDESLLINDFFIRHKLLSQKGTSQIKLDEKDMLKYLCLGMYIYQFVLPNDE